MNYIEHRRNERKILRFNGFEYELTGPDFLNPNIDSPLPNLEQTEIDRRIAEFSPLYKECPHFLPPNLCMICNQYNKGEFATE